MTGLLKTGLRVLLYWALLAQPLLHGQTNIQLSYDASIPQIAFGGQILEEALVHNGYGLRQSGQGLRSISIRIDRENLPPQSFRIAFDAAKNILLYGGDASGAMYGAMEIAELLDLHKSLMAVQPTFQEPVIKRRGLKYNLPLDARTPSYDDTGSAAQQNIRDVWDLSFWTEYLDTLARNRINVLSLWTTHPYPHFIKLKAYPDVALSHVTEPAFAITAQTDKTFRNVTLLDPDMTRVIRGMTIDEKINHWTQVFNHARDRGIEVYVFHWNLFLYGAAGKYNLSADRDSELTQVYLRECVKQFLLTYPQVAGIGVTAGENMDPQAGDNEAWLRNTYGQGMAEALALQPGRQLSFIVRRHWSSFARIEQAFAGFPATLQTSIKPAGTRIYATSRPPWYERWYESDLQNSDLQAWMDVRNDDLFFHRWGDPMHIADFIQQLPRDKTAGLLLGSDGYVWGREHEDLRNAPGETPLSWQEHWYELLAWGRLAYNPDLPRAFFAGHLAARFPNVDTTLLYDTWERASRLLPTLSSFYYTHTDKEFSPEGCLSQRGFVSVADFIQHQPLRSATQQIPLFVKAYLKGETLPGQSPLDIARQLELDAEAVQGSAVHLLQNVEGADTLLRETLEDCLSLAQLGLYYADKIRGATFMALYMESQRGIDQQASIRHLQNAARHWYEYAQMMSQRYNRPLLARTGELDWWHLYRSALGDIEIARYAVPHSRVPTTLGQR